MKNIYKILTVFGLILLALADNSHAQNYQVGQLEVSRPWARASAGKAKNGAAYIDQIINKGNTADRFIGVSSDVAMKTEIHNHILEGGIMKMRQVKGGIEVKPGHPVILKPGSYHIMMMGLKAPLKLGGTIQVTLEFEKAGKILVKVPVLKVGASGKSKMKHDMKMKM
ncbi:MAG: hypothetical protein CMM74_11550 [Rhodospirillaceae bacterium]|nr:hypothetical protein [Rhodospirillaceae bacterium]